MNDLNLISEQLMNEPKKSYHAAFYENLPLGYQSLDEDGRLLMVNQAWLTMLGYPRDEVIGRWFGDFLALNSQHLFKENFAGLKTEGCSTDTEFEMLHRDGTQIIVSIHGGHEYDEQGVFQNTHCILYNVTKQKEAESALRQSEEQYRQMFESHTAIQWLIDPQTQQLADVNEAAATFYGYTREQMRQMKVADLNSHAPEEIAILVAQAQSQHQDSFIVLHRLASGEFRQMEIHAGPVNVNGRSLLFAILHDVTERIQTEEALRKSYRELSFLNQAWEALNTSLDLDRVLKAVLDEVRFTLGAVACSIWLTDVVTGELICRQVTEPYKDVVRGWRLQPGQGIAGWVAQNGRSLIIADAQADKRHFGGVDQKTTLQTRALLCVPLQVKQMVIGVVQVMDTIVDNFQSSDLALLESLAAPAAAAIENAQLHKRLAAHAGQMEQRVVERTRDLVAANEQLKELDRLKTKLIEDISHELRTPVASLSLYLDLLERGKPDKQERYMAVLREKMDQLVQLTEDVLNVSRLDLFKGNVVFELLDLNELLTEQMVYYQQWAREANLDLLFEPGVGLPLVRAERKQLQQVVTNLILNAINYTTAGFVQINTGYNAELRQLVLQVKDSGMGIAPEELPYIFDRFYRGQRVGQFNVPGSGMGLAVVKDVVALHGGVVDVKSEVNKGTVFSMWLPAADND